jgi:hypothetical protein
MEGDPEIKIQPRAPTTEIRCQPESDSGRMGFSGNAGGKSRVKTCVPIMRKADEMDRKHNQPSL